jgi:hypothetical protein
MKNLWIWVVVGLGAVGLIYLVKNNSSSSNSVSNAIGQANTAIQQSKNLLSSLGLGQAKASQNNILQAASNTASTTQNTPQTASGGTTAPQQAQIDQAASDGYDDSPDDFGDDGGDFGDDSDD